MSATTTERAYETLVAELSEGLPKNGLDVSDLVPTTAQLELVMRNHGGSQFVVDALGSPRGRSDIDTFDAIQNRAVVADVAQAALGCGLAVMASLMDHAARQLFRDVEALRDRERPTKYDRAWDDADRYFEFEPREVTP